MPNDTATAERTTIASLRAPLTPEQGMPVVRAGFNDLQGFELMQRQCKALAASTLVPQQFQGNLPNCLIALEMAQRIGASPLMVMQNLYVVHGRPGWSAKFLIASFNQCGRFSAIRFEWSGARDTDNWGCKAYATELSSGEKIVGPLITIALAKKEGWHQKSGSKWQTIPELMLMYRSAAWMVNTHAPEISMGLNTAEELGDVFDAAKAGDGTFAVTSDQLQQQAGAGTAGAPVATESVFTLEDLLAKMKNALDEATVLEILDLGRSLPTDEQDKLADEADAQKKRLAKAKK